MNRIFLIGNLTRDPELAMTNGGLPVCRFSIAVTRRYSNAEGTREADFFNIVVWRAAAENCHKYLKKGSKCAVVGSIQNRTYDAQDGTKRNISEVIADEVEFLTSKNGMGDFNEQVPGAKKDVSELEPIDDDNLPF